MVKKAAYTLLCFILLFSLLLPGVQLDTAAAQQKKIIHLVYDDSGSMIADYYEGESEGVFNDRWVYAKYALEAFTSMMGEGDELSIYYMSENEESLKGAGLQLTGSLNSANIQKNVDAVFKKKVAMGNTPFEAVEKAYKDLENKQGEKILVVLTDGVFEKGGDTYAGGKVNDALCRYAQQGVKVAFLNMSSLVTGIEGDEDSGFFYREATNSKDIRSGLTYLCNKIFVRDSLPERNITGTKCSFDVAMKQLIVFAQGDGIEIESVTGPDGTVYEYQSNVNLHGPKKAPEFFTQTDNKWYPYEKIIESAETLSGSVATFSGYFAPGEYTVNATGSVDTLEVYYTPDVQVQIFLKDSEGKNVDADNIIDGDYYISFEFIDSEGNISSSELLGETGFNGSFLNKLASGEADVEGTVEPNQMVSLKEGSVTFDVEATYLGFSSSQSITKQVFMEGGLVYELSQKPDYILTVDGMTNMEKPLLLTVKMENKGTVYEFTQGEWALIGIPEVSTKADIGEMRVVKTEQTGVYEIYISMKDADPFLTQSGEIPLEVSGTLRKSELSAASGRYEGSFNITNTITDKDRIAQWLEENWIKLVVGSGLAFILLGYVPGIKKRLPKRLAKRPTINCTAETAMGQDMVAHGKYKKDSFKSFIPYIAETGAITVSPSPVKRTLRVKAKGKGAMYLTNVKSFAGKNNILFSGTSIDEGAKKYVITSGETVTVVTPEFRYSCTLNQ